MTRPRLLFVDFAPEPGGSIQSLLLLLRHLDRDRFEPLARFKSRFALHGGPKFTPDGRFVATAGGDGAVKLWDVAAGRSVRRFEGRHSGAVNDVAFSRDGAPIALDGASFWRTEIELRLDSFLLYWERYNMQASQKTYVPRFPVGNFASTFGVKWEFAN